LGRGIIQWRDLERTLLDNPLGAARRAGSPLGGLDVGVEAWAGTSWA